jgi:hypothetical protein
VPPATARRPRSGSGRLVAILAVLVALRIGAAVLLDNQGHLHSPHEVMMTLLAFFNIGAPILLALPPLAIVCIIVALLLSPRKPDKSDQPDQRGEGE